MIYILFVIICTVIVGHIIFAPIFDSYVLRTVMGMAVGMSIGAFLLKKADK